MLNVGPDVQVVGIDEAQFYDMSLVDVAQELADRGIRVIIAGLDTDFLGKPFGPMPYLMAVAEEVRKVHAICVRCGNLANHSHRLSHSTELVVLGEKDAYEPLCRECYNKGIDFPPVLPARPHTRFHGRIRQMRTFLSPPVQPRQCSIVSLQLCSASQNEPS